MSDRRLVQRAKEKERRQQRCNLSDEVLHAIEEELNAVQDGNPSFAKVAQRILEMFELPCGKDWLQTGSSSFPHPKTLY